MAQTSPQMSLETVDPPQLLRNSIPRFVLLAGGMMPAGL
jgi:hypothetical protein